MHKKKGQSACEHFLKLRLPILTWLPSYSFHFFISDMVAGITSGLTLIPQVIGYAALAGLDPQYGLYGGLMGGFVYLFLGTTPQLCIGPTALVSLLTLTYTQNTNVDMVVLLTFLCGCITFLLGVLHLGFLVEFVSGPVVSGFTSAAAFIIASSQVKGLFGLHYKIDDFISAWVQFFPQVQNTLLTDLCLGVVCITLLLLLRKVRDIRVPGGGKPSLSSRHWLSKTLWFITTGRNALVVVICIIVSYILEIQGITPFTLTAHITPGLPGFDLPPITTEVNGETFHLYQMIKHFGGGLIVIPLVQIISSVAIAKAFSNGKSVDSTQEIIAMGVCNILGSCVHSLPVAASFTRSAVNQASGVRTQMRGVFTSGVVILALEFITPYFHYIPRATLASVVICSVLFMVEVQVIKPMWNSNRRDMFPALASFAACLMLGIELGLFVGVLVDVSILLFFNARPDIIIERRTLQSTTGADLHYWYVQPRGYLLFPAVDHLRHSVTTKTQDHSEEGLRVSGLLLDCSRIPRSDFTASQGIQGVVEDMRNKGCPLVLLEADPEIAKSLTGLCLDIRLSSSQEESYQILKEELQKNIGSETGFNGL